MHPKTWAFINALGGTNAISTILNLWGYAAEHYPDGMLTGMTPEDIRNLKDQIRRSEGFRLRAYRCTSGALTVGFGHNCDASPVPGVNEVGDGISHELAESLLEADIAAAVWGVRDALPWVTALNAPRQAVLYDMAFNMGLGVTGGSRGLLSFRNTLRLIEKGDYTEASRNMLQSKWARQTGGRAMRLSRQLDTGERQQ